MNPTIYIGCDAHKSTSHLCAMDTEGNILWEGKRPTTREGFENVRNKFRKYDAKVVVEACGIVWELVDMLSELGFSAYVCNPADLPKSKKTDVDDSRKLANLLRCGYLTYVYIPTKEERKLRSITRDRYDFVRNRTRWTNQCKAFKDPSRIKRRERLLFYADLEIRNLERKIAKKAKGDEDVQRLMSLPGVGETIGLLIKAEICNIERFHSCIQFQSYCGLVPTVWQSGNSIAMGRTKKKSNKLLKWSFVQAAWTAVRCDPRLRKYFQFKAKQKGRKKAIVSIARKLSSYAYWMLTKRVNYQELVSAM